MGGQTKVFWVKGHAEDDGKKTDRHQDENRQADADAEKTYKLDETAEYQQGYVSQFDSVYGPTFGGRRWCTR